MGNSDAKCCCCECGDNCKCCKDAKGCCCCCKCCGKTAECKCDEHNCCNCCNTQTKKGKCCDSKKTKAPKKGKCCDSKKTVKLQEVPEITIVVGGKKITIKIEDQN